MAQNRVTPFGTIEDLPGRGDLMGNRGILHDGSSRTIKRQWASKAWITCVLEYKDWRAAQWERGHYTPLFFLDEATSLAAGHRPCALCRRPDHKRFRAAWGDAPLKELDATLHDERRRRTEVPAESLPDGAMVAIDDRAWLVLGDALLAWSSAGYVDRRERVSREVTLLTPPSIVTAIRHGYAPALHASAS